MHSFPESVAHLWPSIVFRWLKGFWPEQVGKTCPPQNFERLGLPRHNWSTTQVSHEENLVLLAFCAATIQRMQKVLTFIGICYFTAFHNAMYFSAVQSTFLKVSRRWRNSAFCSIDPRDYQLGIFWYQTRLRMYSEATHGLMFTIAISIIVEVTW